MEASFLLETVENVVEVATKVLKHPHTKKITQKLKRTFDDFVGGQEYKIVDLRDRDDYESSVACDSDLSSDLMSAPSLAGSDFAMLPKTVLNPEEQISIGKKLEKAMETEVQKPYKGFRTEPPEHWDPQGTSPPFRQEGTKEEESQRKEIMQEWKEKPERPLGSQRPLIKGFSTEDALANQVMDDLDKEFTPTLQASKPHLHRAISPPTSLQETIWASGARTQSNMGFEVRGRITRRLFLTKPASDDPGEKFSLAVSHRVHEKQQ